MAANIPAPNRHKAVWGTRRRGSVEDRDAPCAHCGTRGSLVDRSATSVFYVCPACEHTWEEPRRAAG